MNTRDQKFTWNELQIGDFYLDNRCHYCIKIGDNTFFDLDKNRMYRKMKILNDLTTYYKCDYEVW
jgi:hypothetical protein